VTGSVAIEGIPARSLRGMLANMDARGTALMLGVLSLASWFVYMRTDFVLDLPLMHFIGWRVGEGDAPYVDLWDMNGPAAYMIHWLMQQVPLPAQTTISLVMTGLTALCVASTATITGRGGQHWLGFAAGVVMVASIAGRGSDMLAQRDMFIAAFAAASLMLVTAKDARAWRWAVAGLLIGLAVGVKPTAAPFAIIAVAGAVWIDLGEGRRFHRTLWLAAGGAVGGFVWLAYLVATGGLAGWWSTMVGYNAAYMKIAREPLLVLLKEPTVTLASVGGVACIVGAVLRRRAGAGREEIAGLMMIGAFALVSAVLYLAQGKGWPYQASPATVMAVLAACAAVPAFRDVYTPKAWTVAAAVVAVCILSLNGIRQQFEPLHALLQRERTAIAGDMTAALQALPPGMKVQPLDTTDGALHAMTDAGRVQASPVLYDFFLFLGADEDMARARAEVLKAAERRDAAFVITNQGWPGMGVGFERVASFTELQSILDTHYTLAATGHRGPYDFRLYAPAQ
jgi:hypothetical protein